LELRLQLLIILFNQTLIVVLSGDISYIKCMPIASCHFYGVICTNRIQRTQSGEVAPVHLSTCFISETTRRISVKLLIGIFTKICQANLILMFISVQSKLYFTRSWNRLLLILQKRHIIQKSRHMTKII